MVITISRTYGSGGRVMGKRLAEKLGFKFYDKELMRILSDETGINEALFGESDEKLRSTYLGTDLDWQTDPTPLKPSDKKYASESNLFKLQAEKIRKIADTEDCVIMGRCADAILTGRDDVVRVFCYANYEDCVKRAMEVCGLVEKEIVKRISTIDKYRKSYYKHFTGNDLYDANNYDICINSGSRSIEELTDFMRVYIYAWNNGDLAQKLDLDSMNI